MTLRAVVFGLLTVFTSTPQVLAETLTASKTVTLATLYEYPPYAFYRTDSSPRSLEIVPPGQDAESLQGFSWDVVRESFHAMGYTLEVSITPWVRAMHNLESGNTLLLFPTGRNSAREQVFAYPQEPVNEVNFRIYTRLDSPIEWEGLASLNNLTIGIMNGYNYGDEWDQHDGFRKHAVLSMENGFRMLALGRIDGFAGYETNLDYALSQLDDLPPFRKLPAFGASREYVVGMKNNPEVEQLLKDFDAGKAAITANGTLDRIIERWR